jgi:hypothetical protein
MLPVQPTRSGLITILCNVDIDKLDEELDREDVDEAVKVFDEIFTWDYICHEWDYIHLPADKVRAGELIEATDEWLKLIPAELRGRHHTGSHYRGSHHRGRHHAGLHHTARSHEGRHHDTPLGRGRRNSCATQQRRTSDHEETFSALHRSDISSVRAMSTWTRREWAGTAAGEAKGVV